MNQPPTADIDHLIALESQHHLWDVEVRGVRLWSQARYTALSRVIARALGATLSTTVSYRRRSLRDIQRYARAFSLFSPFKPANDALFFVTDLGRLPRDPHTSYDRIHDAYFRLFANPLIIESSLTPQASLPDHLFERSIYPRALLALYARLAPAVLTVAEQESIRVFVDTVCTLYNLPEKHADLTANLLMVTARHDRLRQFCERFLIPRIREPRFALVTAASYMGIEGLITAALHDHGFTVTEAQHGLLSAHHPAYHFPADVLEKPDHPARRYLPDIFFTYGEYWSTQAHIPAHKIAIGSPQLATALNTLDPSASPVERQMLVISGDNRALPLAQHLANAFPNAPIIYKLHPLEFDKFDAIQAQLPFANVRVIGKENIYEWIAHCEIIIGHSSTALVEAAAFPNKRIFYYEPAYIPTEVGDQFTSAEHLVELIRDPSRGHPNAKPADFWALDVDARLADFKRSHFTR